MTVPPDVPELSVVICTWNRAALLRDCLDSLLEQDLPATRYEVLVVDDGSTDDTVAVTAAAAGTPGAATVRHLLQPHAGQPAARNRGLAEARGRVVHFFDDDELAPPDLLRRILQELDADPSLAGVGGPYRDRGGSLPTCRRCSLADAGLSKDRDRRHLAERLLGGNMAVRAEVFRKVGGFDPDLAGRGDDTEWFHRAHGHRFLFDPDLWVWHRRDQLGPLGLVRHGFVQGTAIPLSVQRQGKPYRPKPARIPRYLLHALRRRCAKGLWLAARDTGCVLGWLRLRWAGTQSRA